MNTETHEIKVGGLVVDVVRKNTKHLHLAVYPPAGRIRVAVPLRVNDEAVRLAVITRMPWINRHRRKFAGQVCHRARVGPLAGAAPQRPVQGADGSIHAALAAAPGSAESVGSWT
jgi:predicted metal-dependent hydrolase